jgi:hypothetical protein
MRYGVEWNDNYVFENMWKKGALARCMTLYKHLLKRTKHYRLQSLKIEAVAGTRHENNGF